MRNNRTWNGVRFVFIDFLFYDHSPLLFHVECVKIRLFIQVVGN